MATFSGDEEIPEICDYCGNFMQKKDVGLLNMKTWVCVNPRCAAGKNVKQ